MKFPKGNKILYGQDFGWHRGVPSDVDFEVEKINGEEGSLMWLVADGYGRMGGDKYGNGSICVYLKTSFKATKIIKPLNDKAILKLEQAIKMLKEENNNE
jgi:hypothetical protein